MNISIPLSLYLSPLPLDCRAQQKESCSCSSCTGGGNPRYVLQQQSNAQQTSANAIRRRRDLRSHGALMRKRLLRHQQMQERPPRYVKYYHKDLTAQEQHQQQQQQKMRLFGLVPQSENQGTQEMTSGKLKRKTKKTPALSSGSGKRWLGLGRRLTKRDIKGEYDLLEQDRAKIDLTAPEIIQFMPETLNPDFKRGPCHMSCGAITATAPPEDASGGSTEQTAEQQSELPESTDGPTLLNSIPTKRAALGYYPQQQIPSPLSGIYKEYKFVDDSQLRTLLSTTSVPDPLEQNSTPLQFAGDLESVSRRNYRAPRVLAADVGGGYPVEHVADTQLDSIISGIVYQHPEYVDPGSQYGGTLVDPEPVQKKQTTDFLKKLIDGRLGGWGFDTATEPESAVRADYSTKPSKTYGFNSRTHDGYSVDTYNVPPISDYLRAWF